MIDLYHSIAHQGVAKTHAMLQQTWFWPDMVMDVKDKLARCIHCLKTKPKFGKGKITIGHGPHPAGPFMHLHLDFISLAWIQVCNCYCV